MRWKKEVVVGDGKDGEGWRKRKRRVFGRGMRGGVEGGGGMVQWLETEGGMMKMNELEKDREGE